MFPAHTSVRLCVKAEKPSIAELFQYGLHSISVTSWSFKEDIRNLHC